VLPGGHLHCSAQHSISQESLANGRMCGGGRGSAVFRGMEPLPTVDQPLSPSRSKHQYRKFRKNPTHPLLRFPNRGINHRVPPPLRAESLLGGDCGTECRTRIDLYLCRDSRASTARAETFIARQTIERSTHPWPDSAPAPTYPRRPHTHCASPSPLPPPHPRP